MIRKKISQPAVAPPGPGGQNGKIGVLSQVSVSVFSQVPGINPDFGIAGIHGADGWEVEEKTPLNSNSETPR